MPRSGDRRTPDSRSDSLGSMGYQKQEFDAESGELVSAEDELEEEEAFYEEEMEEDSLDGNSLDVPCCKESYSS